MLKFYRKWRNFQKNELTASYGEHSESHFRAGNMCNILAGYVAVAAILIAFYVFANDNMFKSHARIVFIPLYTTLMAFVTSLYFMVLRGKLSLARPIFLWLHVITIVPAITLTGGFPNAAGAPVLFMPIVACFCLYDAKQSLRFTAFYVFLVVSTWLVPAGLGYEISDHSVIKDATYNRALALVAVMIIVATTLYSFDQANRNFLAKSKAASEAKSQFLANMSHEIRTPMNGVIGLTDVLLAQDMPEAQKDIIKAVNHSGLSLLAIIDDILDYSKLDADHVEITPVPFDLRKLTHEVQTLMRAKAEEKDLFLQVKYDDQCPADFVGDDARLRQILLNLVGNGIKFSEEGGVTLAVRRERNGLLRMDVTDTGVGIDKAHQDMIFEQFTQAEGSITRRFGGTGLGLAISRKLARAMGGDIIVESQLGSGSTFSVLLLLPVISSGGKTEPAIEHSASAQTNESSTDALPVIFFGPTGQLHKRFDKPLSEAGHLVADCRTPSDLRRALSAVQKSKVPILVMDWEKPASGFLPIYQKLSQLNPASELNILLCLTDSGLEDVAMPRQVRTLIHPVYSQDLIRALSGLPPGSRDGQPVQYDAKAA